jgi:DNA-binding beta-propeller fold protein YncE
MSRHARRNLSVNVLVLGVGLCGLGLSVAPFAQGQAAPRYQFDPGWPRPLPNKWKIGGVTGLAVDRNDDVWVYNRPNDLTNLELEAELGVSDCCVRPPSMIHIDKNGTVIGSFDAPQGHGMDIDSKGFAYLGQDTVRKYDTRSGKLVGELPRVSERPGGQPVQAATIPARVPGRGGPGPVAGFLPPPAGAPAGRGNADPAAQAAANAAYRAKYPGNTPMIVGGLEEIRLDEANNEIYVADNYLGGRVLVFDMNTFTFKRGWGAYGKPLAQVSTNDADRQFVGNTPPKEFAGHLTLHFSNDGLVYAADRAGDRIHVTTKDGKFLKEFNLALPGSKRGETSDRGAAGGVAFSPDKEQRYLYISDIKNNTIWFLNREDGKVMGRLGSMGESGGSFFGLHMIATDSRGYIYTGEVFAGQRVQRFVPADSARGTMLAQLEKVQ